MTLEEIQAERARRDPSYFIDRFVWINTEPDWEPFRLWPAQAETLAAFRGEKNVVVLKARQLGLSWLALAYALWLMLFRPGTTVLFFSKGEREATKLMDRMKGMVRRLPAWLRPAEVPPTNTQQLTFATGSSAQVFPTTGGRSYTASLVVVDEADWFEGAASLPALLNAVKPTVDAGGQLILLSSPCKSKPESLFKQIYRAAREGTSTYRPVFLPWSARPERTQAWYDRERADCLAHTGSYDDVDQEYPPTEAVALSPRTLDKRIAPEWLQQCYVPAEPCDVPEAYGPKPPAIPGLVLYVLPQKGRRFVIGADPAEGNPTSDESAATVLDQDSGEECAFLAGKFQVGVFADHIEQLARFYRDAALLPERNNHGHALILALHGRVKMLSGHDSKTGWLSSDKGKALMYTACAEAFRDQETTLHSFGTFTQLASIEGSTLRAPEGQHDDRADSYALAVVALGKQTGTGKPPKIFRHPLK